MRKPTPALLTALALAAPALADNCEGRYIPGPPLNGTNGSTPNLLTAATTQGTKLFMAGRFDVAGDKVSRNAAAWNGTSWEAMGVELQYQIDEIPDITQLIYFNNQLYACGYFDRVNGNPAGGLMRWNGLAWLPWTAGTTGAVRGMLIHNGSLYVYGNFSSINGVNAKGIARWNGADFEPVGNFSNTSVTSATVHNGQLTVSGYFSFVNGTPCQRMARFNGTQWLDCDEGVQEESYSLASYNNILYAAGTTDLSTPANTNDGLNYWNGLFWSYLTGGDCTRLRVLGGSLYAGDYGGSSSDVAGISGGIAVFNGSSWSGFGDGIGSWGGYLGILEQPAVYGMDFFGGSLHISGSFSRSGNTSVQNVARWTGSQWTRLNSSTPASDPRPFTAIAPYNGGFAVAGHKHLHNNAVMNDVNWTLDGVNFTAIPGEFDGWVYGLRHYTKAGNWLYAYGAIESVDGQPVEGIARSAGGAWQPLGTGLKMNGQQITARVWDTAVYNDKLVMVGYFNQAGPLPASRIAAFDPESGIWSNFGAGTDGYISHVEVHNGQLYIAGSMTVAGGVPVEGCARWDGNAWHAVGAGQNPPIPEFDDLYEFEGGLYACNYNQVYRLVGDTWQVHSTLPAGDVHNPFLNGLSSYRGELCAVGDMGDLLSQNGGRQIKAYHNGQWTDIHPDPYNGDVFDAMEFRGELIAVGPFTAVGHAVSPGIARYRPDEPYIWDQPDDIGAPCPGSTVDFQLQDIGGPILVHRWYRNNVMLVNGPTGTGSTVTGATSTHMQIANISSADDGLYRCEVTSQCGNATSRTVRLITFCVCGPADVGSTGGTPGPDGQLDNNDFVVYVDMFFNQNPQADVGQQGGIPGADGMFDNNDFVVYIDMFFAGCV